MLTAQSRAAVADSSAPLDVILRSGPDTFAILDRLGGLQSRSLLTWIALYLIADGQESIGVTYRDIHAMLLRMGAGGQRRNGKPLAEATTSEISLYFTRVLPQLERLGLIRRDIVWRRTTDNIGVHEVWLLRRDEFARLVVDVRRATTDAMHDDDHVDAPHRDDDHVDVAPRDHTRPRCARRPRKTANNKPPPRTRGAHPTAHRASAPV